ncbi:MAG: PVC-type heme-binding CxxCH protein [Planctomycetota bacterium]
MNASKLVLGFLIVTTSAGAWAKGPLSPEEALKAFTLPSDLRVEVAASEPLIRDPVAFDWDGRGRLWVAEMHDYPLGVGATPTKRGRPGGRVVVLRDLDGDGDYDRSTVFLDGISYPSAIKAWRDGVIVTAIPDIFYAEDRDGDGYADHRETLYTGFAHGNEQHLANTLAWGLDSWLHCANGDSGGRIQSRRSGTSLNISGRDFRIRPDDGAIEAETGMTQFGRSRDEEGNWFGCNNPTPMYQFVLMDRYLKRNPHSKARGARQNVVGGGGRVYPTSVLQERFNDLHMANRFTSCCGLSFYQDAVLPEAYRGNAFVSEPAHNLVHRMVLERNGVRFRGRRAKEDVKGEFLSSSDNWFRPTMIRCGPDGALWVADIYRMVIEHPQYFYTGNFKGLDTRAGSDRGRIYRIVPKNAKTRKIPRLGDRDQKSLASSLASSNPWIRDKAHELLVQRSPRESVPVLVSTLRDSKSWRVRLHALCALGTLAERVGDPATRLPSDLLLRSLSDESSVVRRHAVRISELFVRAGKGAEVLKKLGTLSADADANVRLQLAYSLGSFPEGGQALAAIAPDSVELRTAILSSAIPHLEALANRCLANPIAGSDELLASVLGTARALGKRGQVICKKVFTSLAREANPSRLPILASSLEGYSPSSAEEWVAVSNLTAPPRRVALDAAKDEASRGAALRVLAVVTRVAPPEQKKLRATNLEVIASLLSPQSSPGMQSAAVRALVETASDETPSALLASWPQYTPKLRGEVLDALLSRAPWTQVLLGAIESKAVTADAIDAERQRRLLSSKDAGVQARAKRVLISRPNRDREAVLKAFGAAATLKGDSTRGAKTFGTKCSVCHRLADKGHAVGPDLAALPDKTSAALLVSILDPNRAVEEKYRLYTLTMRDGRVLSGIVGDESSTQLEIIAQENRRETVLRSKILGLVREPHSMMPEGLEKDLNAQDLADVMQYVRDASKK